MIPLWLLLVLIGNLALIGVLGVVIWRLQRRGHALVLPSPKPQRLWLLVLFMGLFAMVVSFFGGMSVAHGNWFFTGALMAILFEVLSVSFIVRATVAHLGTVGSPLPTGASA